MDSIERAIWAISNVAAVGSAVLLAFLLMFSSLSNKSKVLGMLALGAAGIGLLWLNVTDISQPNPFAVVILAAGVVFGWYWQWQHQPAQEDEESNGQ